MPPSLTDRSVLVDGVRLAYHEQGEGEPVVLVHGTPSHSVIWRNVAPQVAGGGYRAICYDLLGYGRSERPLERDTSVTAQAVLLEKLLARLGVAEVNLVGHDIGGAIVQAFAVSHPERVRRLMLIDTVSYDSWPSGSWRRIIAEHGDHAARMPTAEFEAMLTAQLRMTVADETAMDGDVLEAYLRPHRSALGRASFFEHQVRHYDSRHTRVLTPRLSRLTMPVRILWGEEDRWQPLSYAYRLAEAVPGTTGPAVVPRAGHFLPEEAPDVVVEQALDLLAAPPGPAGKVSSPETAD